MNESLPSPESNPALLPASPPTESAAQSTGYGAGAPDRGLGIRSLRRLIYAGLAMLALLLLAQWWVSHAEVRALRAEVAHRLQTGDTSNTETKLIVKSAQEGVKELQSKVSVLESRQTEAQSQQLALEQLYQDLSKNRDDWALAEIEQVLSTASQQLQLAGNVQGALIALQNADRSLSRSDKPQFITIRRAIARDLDKLKALPSLDMIGIALRLDSIIGQVDGMPLLSDEKPALPATQPKNERVRRSNRAPTAATAERGNVSSDWLTVLDDKWQSWLNEMWTQVRQLIRVRSVDTPDALLLAPGQAYYARENLKLRLLNARLALLSRNESVFRSDMLAAQDAITKYFDTRAKQTQVAQALLKQVQSSNLSIEMPTLVDSLNAVRNYKAR